MFMEVFRFFSLLQEDVFAKEDYQMYFIHFQTLFYFLLSQTFGQHKIRNVGQGYRQNVLYFFTFLDTPCAARCFSKWCQHNGVGSDVSFSVQIHLGTSFQNEINKSKLYLSIWHDYFNVDAYSWNLQYQGYVTERSDYWGVMSWRRENIVSQKFVKTFGVGSRCV